jgi:dTDP-4-amino-4,6-dideoxygalactose transaminase
MIWRRVLARRCTVGRSATPGGCDGDVVLPVQSRWVLTVTVVRCSPKATNARRCTAALRTHGEGTTRYEVLRTGMNGRLDSIQAAVSAVETDSVSRGTRRTRKNRRVLRPAARERRDHSGPRARQHRRRGRFIPSCCRMEPGPWRGAGRAALKTACPTAIYYPRPLASPAGVSSKHHDGAALPVRPTVSRTVFWRCPSIPTWTTRRRATCATPWSRRSRRGNDR